MLCLFLEVALRNEKGEVSVRVTSLLELPVQPLLDLLPYRVPVGAKNHEPLHGGIVSEFSLGHYLRIPFRKVLCLLHSNANFLTQGTIAPENYSAYRLVKEFV